MSTGTRMKERRKAIGLSAEEVAARIGVSAATMYRYEKGDIEKVPGRILEPLAEALCTTPAYLMGWDDDPEDYELADELENIPADWFSHFGGDTRRMVQAYRAMEEDRAREFSAAPMLSEVERELLEAFRNAEPAFREEALQMLKRHPMK